MRAAPQIPRRWEFFFWKHLKNKKYFLGAPTIATIRIEGSRRAPCGGGMEGLGEPWCVHLEVVEASGLWAEYWCV